MIGSHNDHGARCPRHYGEAFLPRCATCLSVNQEYVALNLVSTPDGDDK
jgi:hypothetical protein